MLSGKVFLHMLQKTGNELLVVLDLLLIRGLLLFKFSHEVIDLLLFLIEDLVLLRVIVVFLTFTQISFNLLDVSLVGLNNFSHLHDFLFLLLQISVVLLDTVHELLTSLREGQVHLISLHL